MTTADHRFPAAATPPGPDAAALSPIKRAFLALEQAEARLAASEAARLEPIAVIGVGCRVPGADGPEALWQLLVDGRDAVRPIPRERFDIEQFYDADTERPGGIAVREAGFLDVPVDGFDAGFFGISPREARGMDPQQRLLLEVAWEALENAAQAPDRLSTSATGVFVGQASSDYQMMQLKSGDPALLDSHFTSGVAHSVSSGRLSYLLGLQGPSLTVDTACSSSLVAVHLACQSLRAQECRMAVAGGVNLMLSEDLFIAFSHSRMLAPDGRCKTFDAAADGFGRGEGCAVVVLKRLSDAQADGDRILALIRGSAVNQDGPSSGLTAPNGPAQEAVIRDALARAGVAPGEIGYVEAHGTGTQLGDPLEVQALGHVFGPGRDAARPLLIGSVKTNLGHLEAAAGITGLVKLVLALQHRALPAHLHLRNPSPHIAWDELPLRVPTALQPWEPIGGRRLAGVSSFGFSGTNAHVVVEEAPPVPTAPAMTPAAPQLYTLCARSREALKVLARRHAQALAALPQASLADACRTANAGRAQFAHRAAIVAGSVAELCERLNALAAGTEAPGLRVAHLSRREPARIAFVFTGQGAQYAGMARGLYDSVPAFRAALERCAAAIDPHIGRPLLELLFDPDGAQLDRTEFTQPALFAVAVSLAELWRHWGVTPAVVMGHSVGEVAAATVAGVMSLDDGARLICERARLMGALPEGGAMAAVQATADTVTAALEGHAQVSVAAYNAPDQTVISGAAAQVEALCRGFEARGLRCQRLKVSHAFHSPLVEPMLDTFEAALHGISLSAPRLRLVSNLGGGLAAAGEITQAGYWRRHVREPVRFVDGVSAMLAQRPDVCVEIGPQPALLSFIAPVAPQLPLLASLRRGRPDREQLLEALAGLYLEGASIAWDAVVEHEGGRPMALPTYPFERERHWFSARPVSRPPRARPGAHALLGERLRSAAEQHIHQSRIAAESPSWVAQHRVHGRVVLPATAYLDILLAAAAERHGTDRCMLADVTVQEAMLLDDEQGGSRCVQTVVERPRDGEALVRLSSLDDAADDTQPWTCHVTAKLLRGDGARPPASSLAAARNACTEPVDGPAFYARLAGLGLDFGPAFRSVRRLWQGDGQALGEVVLHETLECERQAYRFHPVQLDGCLQVLAAAVADAGDDALYLPLSIGRYELDARPAGPCWAHVVADPSRQGPTRRADLHVFDADGTLLARVLDLRLKRVDVATLGRLGDRAVDDLIHEIAWRDAPLGAAAQTLAPAGLAAAARERIDTLGAEVGLAAYDAALLQLNDLCAEFVAQALKRLGWSPQAGERADAASLAERLGVVPKHRQLLQRLLAILGEQGWLARDADGWVVRRALSQAEPARGFDALAAGAPPIEAELALTGRTGRELAGAMRGERDALELLFPGGSSETAERVYRDSAPARLFNGLVAELTHAAARGREAGRPLRILEIGGGTGGTTAHVLPRLRGTSVTYTFTDIGTGFVTRARERFAAEHPFMRFQVFDLEQDPVEQGLAEAGFDLILASNVIHATRNLRRSLGRVQRLLAPGGVLAMLEACAPQAWFDLTVGLTEGWWCFEDFDLRPDYPTLSAADWMRLLVDCGFGAIEQIAGDAQARGALSSNALLLAQRPTASAAPRDWLVLGRADGLGGALAERLRARGDGCELITPDSPDFQDPGRRLRECHARRRRWHGVVHALAVDTPPGHDAAALVLGAVKLAQGLVGLGAPARLWLLTAGAQATAAFEDVAKPEAATLWGLARALRLEHPELHTVSLDVDTGEVSGAVDAVLAELDDEGSDNERARRGATRKVSRLVRAPRESARPAADEPSSWRLAPRHPGSLEQLVRVPQPRRAPGPGEVEIEVEASGLNFKDVLNVLGLYPGEAGPLGGECAGRISALGSGVTQFSVGDPVLAVAGGSFASHARARVELVQRRPDGIDAVDGASFAIAYLTAEFCLGHLAGLRAGQRVLIHAAAGGVGMAAVRIAQRVGAQVFATAGSPWKREMLRGLGMAHVFDSRSPSFAEELLEATAGAGVDVVLNSLSGEMIDPSFAVLARGGCFVEIGKRGIKSAEAVRDLGRDLRYHVVDWGETAQRDPALIGGMLARLVDGLRDGTLAPLPRHVFPLDDAARAFRFMAQARHVGRIVVRHPGAPAWAPSPRGSYLVTGGLSGIGLATAAWLAECGAGRLVLVGRRGVTPEAMPVIEAMRTRGTEVWAEALDVSDEQALGGLLSRLRAGGPPLRGIWHSAGVLDDAALLQQDAERFARVFAPKVRAAGLLDRLTRGDALDQFVLFASVAGVLGSAGQSNHSAANAFLDALAHARSAQGLAALSIDWGAWRDIGAAADRGIGERLAAQGLVTISPAQGLAAMERLLERPRQTQAAVLAIDWPTYLARVVPGGHSALLAEVCGGPAPAAQARQAAESDLSSQLSTAPESRRRPLLLNFVRERALRALGMDPAKALDPRTPLGDLGMDSLLAVEIRNTLGAATGRSLPATLLFDHPTVDALTDYLFAELFEAPAAAQTAAAAAPEGAHALVGSIEELSDDDVDRLLAERAKRKV